MRNLPQASSRTNTTSPSIWVQGGSPHGPLAAHRNRSPTPLRRRARIRTSATVNPTKMGLGILFSQCPFGQGNPARDSRCPLDLGSVVLVRDELGAAVRVEVGLGART